MIKYITLIFFFSFFIAFNISFVSPTIAAGSEEALNSLNVAANEAYGDTQSVDVSITIGKIVGAILSFVGVIFLILMIYGGFTWMMARGNEQEVAKAKEIITNAVIGLIVVLSAYAITAYIGNFLTGQS